MVQLKPPGESCAIISKNEPRADCPGCNQRTASVRIVFQSGLAFDLCIGCARRMYQTMKRAQDESPELQR